MGKSEWKVTQKKSRIEFCLKFALLYLSDQLGTAEWAVTDSQCSLLKQFHGEIGNWPLSSPRNICSIFTLRYFKSFQINYVFFPTFFLCPASSCFIFLASRSGNLATSWILLKISEHISAAAPAQNKIYGYWLVTESDRKTLIEEWLMKQLKICCKCCWESTHF